MMSTEQRAKQLAKQHERWVTKSLQFRTSLSKLAENTDKYNTIYYKMLNAEVTAQQIDQELFLTIKQLNHEQIRTNQRTCLGLM